MRNPERHFQFGILLTALMLIATGNGYPMVLLLGISTILLFRRNHSELAALQPYGGWANYLTLLRAMTLVVLLLLPAIHDSIWPGILGLAVALADVLDGWLAKKLNCRTTAGSIIDDQTDALFMLVLGFIAYRTSRCGAYILIPGIVKYGKDLLSRELSGFFKPHIRIPFSKTVAGIGFIAYATPFLLEKTLYEPLCIGAVVLLCISFGSELALRWTFRKTSSR